MNRRDFLLLRTEESKTVAELSCEKLFMHYQDLGSDFQQAEGESGTLHDAEWWVGEPPLSLNHIDPLAFFRSVQTDIIKADKLRVLDMEWLAQGEFRIRIETLLASFKATGGEVLYKNNSTEEVRRAI